MEDLGGDYTSIKNKHLSLHFSLPFTPKSWKHIRKMETFESGDLSVDFKNGASKNTHVNK